MESCWTKMGMNRFWKYELCILILFGLFLYIIMTFTQSGHDFLVNFYSLNSTQIFLNSSSPIMIDSSSNLSLPLVLIWTNFFSVRCDSCAHMFDRCPAEYQCRISFNRSDVNESMAVMFHIRDMNWGDVPKWRNPDQYYVFSLWESPHHTFIDISSPGHRDFFNLTLSHRLDSDQPAPYGNFGLINSERSNLNRRVWNGAAEDLQTQIVQGKSKLLAWFVSNCNTPSKREKFVEELKKYVSVDIYGKCGALKCPRGQEGTKAGLAGAGPCNWLLTRDYKFYLSLENSICKDYVTEKLYSNMEKSIVVPVVMERKLLLDTIRDEEIAKIINRSFIAVDDFRNVQQLVEYLKYLDKNETAYGEYLQWRNSVELVPVQNKCQLCKIITEKKSRKIENINAWWTDQAHCHQWKSP